MTVAKTNDFDGPYLPDGATVDFPFTFSCGGDTELDILLDDEIVDGGYTVAINPNGSGGNITFAVPPSNGTTMYIVSAPGFTQTTSFENAGQFLPRSHDQIADRHTRQAIYLKGLLARTAQVPVGETMAPLPRKADRAGKYQAFDADGNPIATSGLGADAALRGDLATGNGNLIGYGPPGGGDPITLKEALDYGALKVEWFPGATAVEKIINAFTNAPDGATLMFEPGGVSVIDQLLQIGEGSSPLTADVATAKNLKIIAEGHTFRYTTNGARIEINAPISNTLYLSANYVAGQRTITVAFAAGQLADFTDGTWIKICSDALDGWQRNQGTQLNQYRLAEFAQIRKVVDNLNGTATLTLWNPLRFTRGFQNTGDAENLTEINTYTTAMNARVVALKLDGFSWRGGKIECVNPVIAADPVGWDTRALLRLQGFVRPLISGLDLGPGAGKGLELNGCVNFTVNDVFVHDCPDDDELLANQGIATAYLGYGIAIAGCWGGTINNLTGRDCRHIITETSSNSQANSITYGILLSIGRTYGTRINNATSEGQYAGGVDCHHGAHSWVISNLTVEGSQDSYGVSVRGPGHTIIAPRIIANKGLQVLSDYQADGGSDLPALNGNGNKWMSSCKLIGGDFDVTHEVLRVGPAYLTVEGGLKARCRTHTAFMADGGVIDFSTGRVELEITGEATAQSVNANDGMQRGIFMGGSTVSAYGVTWTPGFIVREGAYIEIDAVNATDTLTLSVVNQEDTGAQFVLRGSLVGQFANAGWSDTVFGGGIYSTIDETAVLDLTGNALIAAKFPKWDKGKVRIANLVQGVAQRLFTFYDGFGGTSSFVAIAEVFVGDANSGGFSGRYQIQDSFSAASGVEATFLHSQSGTLLEANTNVDLTTTGPTAGKVGFSFFNGGVFIRHDVAGATYEDVWVRFTMLRQPLKP